MKVVILRFPGTNCEFDTQYAFKKIGIQAQILWYKEKEFKADLLVLPGGFSYGDYLRCGAIAKFAPAMQGVFNHAKKGGYILGICNGFQILLETGLLKGAMRQNKNINFLSKNQNLRVVSNNNIFLRKFQKNELISLPIAHGEGNYYTDSDNLKELEDKDLILLKYEPNLNGSLCDIAGICDANKKIFALMPHPERACDKLLGNNIGLKMLEGFL
ncbi:phosphoribosylformylglycinamidine synthase subunit PurQ [Campylobacter sp. MIT 21-1685]|uniref:phosphoribosylformylglycinamidine synthase subunit PurQ n=1 Tax=unclassified Campylobacter TaxID=2593542 RepID=UPI00224B332F|nr:MULTISPECIES: phosphoribosylformylglycinamidine synthase subunit PurQ [unclassified Campylobacter]MCX2682569.1 phosphoribosylformylglycinamidine synthase subunit PurQ [Campylobacter sp. MIT 21-1684]MCX2750718.1 phosphoribosylformylglycinamidine synthase subunit PurQ [Campylobacter sp. MIT 21-1682]MCX2807050.1 phosphoribosylformylglycinamidine synthase subunit PurQ [Campylobacter sp. MIT 21-1685]